MAGFPMGFRFHPTDVEKLTYLLYKVSGLHLPCSDLIGTADLYGEKEPWEILGDSDEGELYFFTMLKKVGKKKDDYKRFSRNVGKRGTWSNKGQKVAIYGKRGGLIGHKRCFRYEAKKELDDQIKGTWLLKEYTLPDNYKGAKEEYKDCVLCLLKRKRKKKKKEKTPRVLDDIYNNIYTENPALLAQESSIYDHQESSHYDHQYPLLLAQESSHYDHHAYGETLRNIAEQFAEEEQSTNLQSNYTGCTVL